MARSGINKVILLGNLGADPELRTTAGGDAVATISIATSDSWKDKNTGEEQQKTEWHRVVFFRRMAEVVGQYLKKGSWLLLEHGYNQQDSIIECLKRSGYFEVSGRKDYSGINRVVAARWEGK